MIETRRFIANASPRSRSFQTAHRIASRLEPAVAAAFLAAIARIQAGMNDAELTDALASGRWTLIEAAALGGLIGALSAEMAIRQALLRTTTATGVATARLVEDATSLEFQFNAVHPNVVMYARTRAAELVVAITEDTRESVRVVLALGQQGMTPIEQARAIREIVGLPPNWANAPLNLARELRNGRFTTSRRLSASDKAEIRSRLAKGTVDDAFISKMQGRYARSLLNRRAQNIARTETLRASHAGQREAWKQATSEGVLPQTARRMWIVTPDDRLRPTHAAIPGMNPEGVKLDEPFNTPIGRFFDPPIEPNCRCGVGLVFPGKKGVL